MANDKQNIREYLLSYLHDDLSTISLSEETIRTSLGLWPVLERREGLPVDLAKVVTQLEVGE